MFYAQQWTSFSLDDDVDYINKVMVRNTALKSTVSTKLSPFLSNKIKSCNLLLETLLCNKGLSIQQFNTPSSSLWLNFLKFIRYKGTKYN